MQHRRGILSSHYLDGIWPQAHNCSGRVSEVLILQVGATSPIFLPFLKRSAAAGSWETDPLWLHQPLALCLHRSAARQFPWGLLPPGLLAGPGTSQSLSPARVGPPGLRASAEIPFLLAAARSLHSSWPSKTLHCLTKGEF